MNRKWLPHGITAGALVVFIVLGLACASSPSPKWANITYKGEETLLLTGTKWAFTLIKDGNSYRDTVAEFWPDGKLVMMTENRPWERSCTWQRIGNKVQCIISGGTSYYEGTLDQQNKKIWGSGENSYGEKYNWTMELIE